AGVWIRGGGLQNEAPGSSAEAVVKVEGPEAEDVAASDGDVGRKRLEARSFQCDCAGLANHLVADAGHRPQNHEVELLPRVGRGGLKREAGDRPPAGGHHVVPIANQYAAEAPITWITTGLADGG